MITDEMLMDVYEEFIQIEYYGQVAIVGVLRTLGLLERFCEVNGVGK